MEIITFEGLPLSGKTQTALKLTEKLNKSGYKCIYRHGQITENSNAKICIEKAFNSLKKWDYGNKDKLYDFIKYRYEQLNIDFDYYKETIDDYQNFDYIILDRYFTGHDVIADYFLFDKSRFLNSEVENYISKEILLVCDFEERLRRSNIRKKTNALTKYTLENKAVHQNLNLEYNKKFNEIKNSFKLYSSNNYISTEEITNKLIVHI